MRILLTTFGTRGDLNPYLAIAGGLAARGHEPVVATHEYWRADVESEGLAFRPVRPDAHPEDKELFARAMHPRWGPAVVLREMVLPALRESHADTFAAASDADAIVSHPLSLAAPIVAAERGLPWISTVLAPLSFFSRHDFPVLGPLPHAWRLYGIPGVVSLVVRTMRSVTRSWTRPVRQLREELGLPPGGDPLQEGQHSPLRTLALFSRVLADPQPDWPKSTRVTGFAFRDAPSEDEPDARRLEAFLVAGPPPVVFTLGSSAVNVAGRFYDESLAAARRLGRRAVLLVGDEGVNRISPSLHDDAIAIARAPHRALFPRAAAIVHHGGIGTLAEGLRSGRPMLVVPWSHDQPDNARRAARLGVARVLSSGRYRAARAAAALEELLDDPVCAARAGEVSRIVREEDGVSAACEEIATAVRG
ncbi:MAG TPA: glycosyltransferase [Gemmatimonadota bacterium]|nr:glycosyltransferase [Gemmatimonadota bacterium]